jgi:hypothetical protein
MVFLIFEQHLQPINKNDIFCRTIGNILKSGNNSQMDSETNNTEDDTEEIRVEFLLDDISQDPIEANVVSPLIIGTDSSMDSDTINSTCDMQSVDLSSVRPTGTPTTSRNARLNSPMYVNRLLRIGIIV